VLSLAFLVTEKVQLLEPPNVVESLGELASHVTPLLAHCKDLPRRHLVGSGLALVLTVGDYRGFRTGDWELPRNSMDPSAVIIDALAVGVVCGF
jgi:hypothetical protein